jgi:hypothetical protein
MYLQCTKSRRIVASVGDFPYLCNTIKDNNNMKPTIRLGRLRFFKQSNWENKKGMKIDFFSIEVDLTYKFICFVILNFEFEIDW